MAPLPRWLKDEFRKVKLLKSPSGSLTQSTATLTTMTTMSTATLPSMDSSASPRKQVKSVIPEEEMRRMFFLREQLGGNPLMRGSIEDLWVERQRLDAERVHLRSAELREVRQRQRATARQQRLEASGQAEGEDWNGDDFVDESSMPFSLHTMGRPLGRRISEHPESSLASGKAFRAGAQAAEAKLPKPPQRINVLSFVKHRSTCAERQNTMNRLRQEMKRKAKGQDTREISKQSGISDLDQTIPKYASWLAEFQRHDSEKTGLLKSREGRSAFADIGLQPRLAAEKRMVAKLIRDEMHKLDPFNTTIDFNNFVALVPRIRDIRNELSRPELEELFARGCTKDNGHYDMEKLPACLEALGCSNVHGDAEKDEVTRIYEGFHAAETLCKALEHESNTKEEEVEVKPVEPQTRKKIGKADERSLPPSPRSLFRASTIAVMTANTATAAIAALPGHQKVAPVAPIATKEAKEAAVAAVAERGSAVGLGVPDTPFQLWEMLFHRSKERLIVLRRTQEREIARNMHLTAGQFEHVRSNIIELHALFQQFDADGSGSLGEEEVLKCLSCCGLHRKNGMDHSTLLGVLTRAKLRTAEERDAENRAGAESEEDDKSSNATVPSLPSLPGSRQGSRPGSKPPSRPSSASAKHRQTCPTLSRQGSNGSQHELEDAFPQANSNDLSFAEFLTLIMMMRKISREAHRAELRSAFLKYDADGSGLLQVKEILGLFTTLGLKPKNREEQQDIRMLLDEVDEDGDGEFSFKEFEFLVHQLHERLDRLTRKEEEVFALEIGIPRARCRELQDVFRAAHEASTSLLSINGNCLSVAELRKAMQDLFLRFNSEELLTLYTKFGREESSQDEGGVDGKGFLRMMHAIEIEGTHKPTQVQTLPTLGVAQMMPHRQNSLARSSTMGAGLSGRRDSVAQINTAALFRGRPFL